MAELACGEVGDNNSESDDAKTWDFDFDTCYNHHLDESYLDSSENDFSCDEVTLFDLI